MFFKTVSGVSITFNVKYMLVCLMFHEMKYSKIKYQVSSNRIILTHGIIKLEAFTKSVELLAPNCTTSGLSSTKQKKKYH